MKRTLRYTRNNCKTIRNEFETFCSLREKSVCIHRTSTWEGGVGGESVCPGDVSAESDFHSPRKCFQTITTGRYDPNGRTYSIYIYIYNVIIGDLRYFHVAKTYYYVALWVRLSPRKDFWFFFSDFRRFPLAWKTVYRWPATMTLGNIPKWFYQLQQFTMTIAAAADYLPRATIVLRYYRRDTHWAATRFRSIYAKRTPVERKQKWRITILEIVTLKLSTSNNIIAKLAGSRMRSKPSLTLRTATLASVQLHSWYSRTI